MKVLVIPDVHLKPLMFDRAAELLKVGAADRAVCLMDIPDDWRQEFNLDLYLRTFDSAIRFATYFPETLWCYGNHDICYLWDKRESGYSKIAAWTVCEKLRKLQEALSDKKRLTFLHRIDNVIFCHGGLTDEFVRQYVPAKYYSNADAVIDTINSFGAGELWQTASPLWYRPQHYGGKLYKSRIFLQVVGHTPVETITKKGNLISCDVFSTYRDGKPIGTQEFPIIDTDTREYVGIH
jgi:hypothetical protein